MNLEPYTIEGEVLPEAVLSAQAMAYMNFARIEHDRLEQIAVSYTHLTLPTILLV